MKAGAYVETQAHGPFEAGDSNINRLLKQGKNTDEIIQILSDEDFYSCAQMKLHYEREMVNLQHADEGCDITFPNTLQSIGKKRWCTEIQCICRWI